MACGRGIWMSNCWPIRRVPPRFGWPVAAAPAPVGAGAVVTAGTVVGAAAAGPSVGLRAGAAVGADGWIGAQAASIDADADRPTSRKNRRRLTATPRTSV